MTEKGVLEDTVDRGTGAESRQLMNLDLGEVSDQSDTGVFPTPTSLLTTPGTPGEAFFMQAPSRERTDSGILTSPEGPGPARLEDTRASVTSTSTPSAEVISPVSSSSFSLRSDDTDVLLIESTRSTEPQVSSDTSDTATLVSDTDSSNTTYLLARLDQTLPGYVPPGGTPDSTSTPSLVGADAYARSQEAYLESSVDLPFLPADAREQRPGQSRTQVRTPDTEPRTLSVCTPISSQVTIHAAML